MNSRHRKSRPVDIPTGAREAVELARHVQTPRTLSRTSSAASKESTGELKALSQRAVLSDVEITSSAEPSIVTHSLPLFSLAWSPRKGGKQDLNPALLRQLAEPTGLVCLLRSQKISSNELALAFISTGDNKFSLSHLLYGWLPEALAHGLKMARKPRETKKSGPGLPIAFLAIPAIRHDYIWYRFEQPASDRFLRLSPFGVKLPSSELITAEQAIKTILSDQAKIAGLTDNSPSQIALPPKYFDLTVPIE